MWLINTTTLGLHEFIDANHAPPYAILSHCWGEGEISFKDFRKKRNCIGPGYEKIVNCCKYAREVGYEGRQLDWAWVDTCCIDKRSSAELSEAINSMFTWYEKAEICYAFLDDVDRPRFPFAESTDSRFAMGIAQSRWFSRGWTLQELLAPNQVHFFNANWSYIGSKHNAGQVSDLTRAIADCAGMPFTALTGHVGRILWNGPWSVAQRMSWASRRQTTRVEDEAYCLLGIFQINMPLLYGEGPNAFQRLQREILRQELAESIFAWKTKESMNTVEDGRLLAKSPSDFSHTADVFDSMIDEIPSITPRGRGFELTIPSPPQTVVHCHVFREELLVFLRAYRYDYPDKPHQTRRRVVRCILQLEYDSYCGHWSSMDYWGDMLENYICDEADILWPSHYRPVLAGGSIFIHAINHNKRCRKRDQTSLVQDIPATTAPAIDSALVLQDAQRLNIKPY